MAHDEDVAAALQRLNQSRTRQVLRMGACQRHQPVQGRTEDA
jgi:hypothetical protein